MNFGKALKTGIEIAGAISAVKTTVDIGEAVGAKLGVIDPSVRILQSGANMALDVVGLPPSFRLGAKPAASAPPASTPTVGDAQPQASVAPSVSLVCPDCQGSDILSLSGPARLAQCERHRNVYAQIAGYHGDMYQAWADAWGLGDAAPRPALESFAGENGYSAIGYSAALIDWQHQLQAAKDAAKAPLGDAASCGPQPDRGDARYRALAASVTITSGPNAGGAAADRAFGDDLTKWNKCVAAEQQKAATDAASQADKAAAQAQAQADKQSAVAAAVAASKAKLIKAKDYAAKMMLNSQKAKYEKQIADAAAAQAQAKTDAEKSAMQAQIDAANAAKAATEKMLADLQASQKDASMQAQLDLLKQQVLDAGKSGNMDALTQSYVAQQFMQPPPAYQVPWEPAAAQAMWNPAQAAPGYLSPGFAPPGYGYDMSQYPDAGMGYPDDGGMFFAGTADTAPVPPGAPPSAAGSASDTKIDSDVTDALGLEGFHAAGFENEDEANELLSFRLAGVDITPILNGQFDEDVTTSGNCAIGSCGIRH